MPLPGLICLSTDWTSFDKVMSEPGSMPEPDAEQPPIPPWALEPMVNVYQGERGPCYLWLRFVAGWPDLELEECEQDWHGVEPLWLYEVMNDSGLDTIMDLPHHRLEWVLSEGLSPGQPFCIEVYPPTWSKSGSYYEVEWDCDFKSDIVRVMPRKPLTAALSWRRYLDAVQRDREREERAKERVRQRRMSDSSALYLHWERYDRYGIRVTLCSKHIGENNRNYFSYGLFSGEDECGIREVAMTQLLDLAIKEGIVARSRWDRLRHPNRNGMLLSVPGFRKLPEKWDHR